jgi:hypothetical protein
MAKVRLLYVIEDGKRRGVWEDAFFQCDQAINEDIWHTKKAFLKAAAVFEQSIKEIEQEYQAETEFLNGYSIYVRKAAGLRQLPLFEGVQTNA